MVRSLLFSWKNKTQIRDQNTTISAVREVNIHLGYVEFQSFVEVPLSFVPSMDNGSDIFSIISKMMDLWDKRPFTFHLSDIHVDADSKDSAI
jgi:hypothetical protein